jgi:hypothetical protein
MWCVLSFAPRSSSLLFTSTFTVSYRVANSHLADMHMAIVRPSFVQNRPRREKQDRTACTVSLLRIEKVDPIVWSL